VADEILLSVLVIALLLGLLICAVILPIVAFIRTRGIPTLRARLDQLEVEVRQATPAETGMAVRAPSASAVPLPIETQARQLVELSLRLERLEQAMRQPPTAMAAEAAAPKASRPHPAAQPSPPSRPAAVQARAELPWQPDARSLEAWIGRHGLGWVAVLLLLFATAFFLKYAFENRWIGELGRVSLGVLAGEGLCLAGLRYHRRGWHVFSQMLFAGGVVLLYLATYGAFGYYHLIPQRSAAIFLMALVAESAALAALYEAPAIALMALIGGLLTPLLLHTDVDQYRSLFAYLLFLNAGLAGLAFFKRWRAIGNVALLGTQLLFSTVRHRAINTAFPDNAAPSRPRVWAVSSLIAPSS